MGCNGLEYKLLKLKKTLITSIHVRVTALTPKKTTTEISELSFIFHLTREVDHWLLTFTRIRPLCVHSNLEYFQEMSTYTCRFSFVFILRLLLGTFLLTHKLPFNVRSLTNYTLQKGLPVTMWSI